MIHTMCYKKIIETPESLAFSTCLSTYFISLTDKAIKGSSPFYFLFRLQKSLPYLQQKQHQESIHLPLFDQHNFEL